MTYQRRKQGSLDMFKKIMCPTFTLSPILHSWIRKFIKQFQRKKILQLERRSSPSNWDTSIHQQLPYQRGPGAQLPVFRDAQYKFKLCIKQLAPQFTPTGKFRKKNQKVYNLSILLLFTQKISLISHTDCMQSCHSVKAS